MRDLKAMRRKRNLMSIEGLAFKAFQAEAFLVALSPTAATIAMLISFLLWLICWKMDDDVHFRHFSFDKPLLVFVIISGLSVLVSPDKAFSFYNYYNLVGAYAITYIVAGQLVRTEERLRSILEAFAVSAAIVVLYGFYQFIFGIDISAMKWVDGDAFPELRKRVFSTWENPNILAGYLDIIICLAFGFFIKAESKAKRLVLGIFVLAAASCLAMTYARGALLVIAVIFVLYGMVKDWRVLAACVVVGGVLLLADPVLYERLTSVFTKVDTSSEMRLAFWESSLAMIQDHPFLGIGWGSYWMVYPEYDFYLQGADIRIVHAHNLYLNYAAEIGIPGAIAFLWYLLGTMIMALRQKFLPPEPAPVEATPFDYNEEAVADVELQKVADSVKPEIDEPKRPFWQDCADWMDYRLLGGLSLGLGLAILSVALNGFTDDLLFNIPSSMFLWMLAAMAASVAAVHETATEEKGEEEN